GRLRQAGPFLCRRGCRGRRCLLLGRKRRRDRIPRGAARDRGGMALAPRQERGAPGRARRAALRADQSVALLPDADRQARSERRAGSAREGRAPDAGILDFAAVITAERALDADGDAGQSDLSTAKCREIFDAARPETRAFLMAGLFATRPDVFVGAAKLGDNLWRAMLEKFTETYGPEFDQFRRAKRK